MTANLTSQKAVASNFVRRAMFAIVVIAAANSDPSAQTQSLTAAPCPETHRTFKAESQRDLPTALELRQCETHTHLLSLDAGQYVRFAMRLHGIDATMTAFAPDGTLLHQVTEPYIIEGKKSVWFVTKAKGTYRLEVQAAGDSASGSYDLNLQRTCAATEDNLAFMRIDQGINEGLELQETGTEKALRQAIPLLIEVASLAAKNKSWPDEKGITGTVDWYRGTPLMYLGEIFLSLGEYDNALEAFHRTLAVEAWGDRGWTLKGIGDVYKARGDKQQALEYYLRSLPAFEVTYSGTLTQRGPAIAKSAIGALYASLGDYEQALTYLDHSLLHWRHDGEIRGEADTLMQISEIYVRLERYGDALGHYDKALRVYRSTSDHLREGRALCAAARVRITLGDSEKALSLLDDSLRAALEAGDRQGRADALTELGRAFNLTANNDKALEYLHESLEIYRSLKAVHGEAASLFLIARAERDSGKLLEARHHIEAAIAGIEAMRIGLTEDQLRASYLATVRDYFDLYVDLLMRMHRASPGAGFESEALRVSERARARSFVDSLSAALSGVSGASAMLLERRRSLWQRISMRVEDRLKIRPTLERWEETVRLRAEYDVVEEQVRAANKRYASLTNPRTLNAREIQGQLDDGTLLLEYSLGDEHSYLWAVSAETVASYQLPKRSVIEKTARSVYDLLTARNRHLKGETTARFAARVDKADRDYKVASARLSETVLGPVATELGAKRLVIVAEGALQFIPFATLPRPRARAYRPLVVDHEIVTLPSASVLTLLREEQARSKPAPKAVAVLADPVFTADDPRLRGKHVASVTTAPKIKADLERAFDDLNEPLTSQSMPRLFSTRWEAEQITSRAGGASFRALDFDASRETAMSDVLKDYRIVHFASHAIIDEIHPELSGLVLSMVDEQGKARNGYLRTEDIYKLKLSADLVVLSACRTGLGKDVRGEGLVGLTRGFMYAGAPRVVVSLWKVNDQATADLMVRFYRQMFPRSNPRSSARKWNRNSTASALRSAQLEMLKNRRWQSPYYWAGFTLQGEWR